jgi:hypothetical protein
MESRRAIAALLVACATTLSAQMYNVPKASGNLAAAPAAAITLTTTSTVQNAAVYRPGVVIGGLANYGANQYLKNLNFANGGDMPSAYFDSPFTCQSGGTNDSTHWYNNSSYASGFPANFWVGATYQAFAAATGNSLGTGTITASTTNTSTGLQFTLSNALSATCSTANQDVLLVTFFNAPASLTTPANIYNFGGSCSGTAWSSDTSPSSTNTIQSLQLPDGCSFSYYMDVAAKPGTNTNSTVASTNASWINLNGSYTLTFKYKCQTPGTGSVHFSLGRNGGTSYVSGTTLTPTCSATSGSGWTTYTQAFSASETGSQVNGGLLLNFSGTSGSILLQDVEVNEGSTLTGNSTPFRDGFVVMLQNLQPSSLRFMDGSDWGSYIPDEIGPSGNNRWDTFSEYGPFPANAAVGYAGKLSLCLLVNADCWLTVGPYNSPSNWATLITWLSTQGYISSFSTAGLHIRLEQGNEQWNFGSQGQLYNGNGLVYGTVLGPNMAAAKAASGYNSSVIKLVGDGWIAQGYNSSGQWGYNSLTKASATTNGLPDETDNAVYMLDYLGSFTASGSNVSTTGAPFLDAFAEDANFNIASPTGGYSMLNNTSGALANFGLPMDVYEANWGAFLFGQGASTTQLQMNQMGAGVGEALATVENYMLLQRDSKVTGPIHSFVMQQDEKGAATGGSQLPFWGIIRTDACGPGQLGTCADTGRPIYILQELFNTAMGSNTKLMQSSQSGTPTYSQANSQSVNCPGSNCYQVWANSAVPEVQCGTYSDGANHWTVFCFNNDLASSHTVNIAGPGAPTGSVTEYTLPGSGNVITDNNENTYIGPSSIAPVVSLPSPVTTSGTTFSIPAASMVALVYTH